jgi:endonuclease/exonuclease/phosphatase family metal-dependent hydrolase
VARLKPSIFGEAVRSLIFLPLLASFSAIALAEKPIRVATYNVSLYSDKARGLIERLEQGDAAAKKIAAVIQHQRPDILLLNEFDYDADGIGADLFQKKYLAKSQFKQNAITYPYRYFASVNTGMASGFDLNNDGKISGGNDAFGFGNHPGQYGMLVLSQFPIDKIAVRTFQKFLWKDFPNSLIPMKANGVPWYSADAWNVFRLSSKSHWDVPINTPLGTLHFLASHPTPPVFDGVEDRNGKRNHDEIQFWGHYVWNQGNDWIVDDLGLRGGLQENARFVIAGDLNADPIDGDGMPGTIVELLENPKVARTITPRSEGAVEAALADAGENQKHRGAHHHDTGNFGPKVGNLRLDYVLPSAGWQLVDKGVFWPKKSNIGSEWIDASDHHMVWVDIANY